MCRFESSQNEPSQLTPRKLVANLKLLIETILRIGLLSICIELMRSRHLKSTARLPMASCHPSRNELTSKCKTFVLMFALPRVTDGGQHNVSYIFDEHFRGREV